jgi:Fe-S-cluster-containing hydrogenase component 2
MICGASSHDVARIRNLSMLYATLGVDCVDAAADTAVMAAVREGFAAATALSEDRREAGLQTPWLMVSVNDNEDPHFRKATFPTSACPSACARPCEFVCPADAIDATGVLADICYGCGRCIPVCPESIISAVSYVHSADYVCQLLCAADAVEIHTSSGNDADFRRLWEAIGETAIANLKLVAVSFPDPGTDQQLAGYLKMMAGVLGNLPDSMELVWQTDGRPMSGDIGRGTAKASVVFGGRVRRALWELNLPGHVQLAGGTNDASGPLLSEAGLLHVSGGIAGVAIGSHARKVSSSFPIAGLTFRHASGTTLANERSLCRL